MNVHLWCGTMHLGALVLTMDRLEPPAIAVGPCNQRSVWAAYR